METYQLILDQKCKKNAPKPEPIVDNEIIEIDDDDDDDGTINNNNNTHSELDSLDETDLLKKRLTIKTELVLDNLNGTELHELSTNLNDINLNNVIEQHTFARKTNNASNAAIPVNAADILTKYAQSLLTSSLSPPKEKNLFETANLNGTKSNANKKQDIKRKPSTFNSTDSLSIAREKLVASKSNLCVKQIADGCSEISSDESDASTVDFEEQCDWNGKNGAENEKRTCVATSDATTSNNIIRPQRLNVQSATISSHTNNNISSNRSSSTLATDPAKKIESKLVVLEERPFESIQATPPYVPVQLTVPVQTTHRTNLLDSSNLFTESLNTSKGKTRVSTIPNGSRRMILLTGNDVNCTINPLKEKKNAILSNHRALQPNAIPKIGENINRTKDMSVISSKNAWDPSKYATPLLPRSTQPSKDIIKKLVIQKASHVTATEKNAEQKATTTNGHEKQSNVFAAISGKKTPLVDYYDSSSMSSSSSSSSYAKSGSSDAKEQTHRSKMMSSASNEKSSGSASDKIKQHESSKATETKYDGKTKTKSKHNRSKCSDPKPSTSKQHTNKPDQSNEYERIKSIRRAVRAINGLLTDSQVRTLTDEFVEKIKIHPENVKRTCQSTQTETQPEMPPLEKVEKESPKEKSTRKRFHDKKSEKIELNRELDLLIDHDSFHYTPGPLTKRRRRSIHTSMIDDNSSDSSEKLVDSNAVHSRRSNCPSTSKNISYEDGKCNQLKLFTLNFRHSKKKYRNVSSSNFHQMIHDFRTQRIRLMPWILTTRSRQCQRI